MAVANYHDWAERHWGVVRRDGSKEPGYGSPLGLVEPQDLTRRAGRWVSP